MNEKKMINYFSYPCLATRIAERILTNSQSNFLSNIEDEIMNDNELFECIAKEILSERLGLPPTPERISQLAKLLWQFSEETSTC